VTQIGRSSRRHHVAVPGTNGRISLAWAALTDKGYRREANQDSLVAKSPVFAVADGMGGHYAGDVASAAVVTRLAGLASPGFVDEEAIGTALRDAVTDMGDDVGKTDLGTGTTVTGFALTLIDGEPHWLVFNIGDSRVYELRDGEMRQLTVDHSIVQELLDAGAITPDEAEVHPHANVITRAVGFNEDPIPDFGLVPLTPGSRLLACSDGLTKELTEHGIFHFLSTADSPLDAAGHLMDAALGNGGRDNVTVVVVDVLGTPESPQRGGRHAARLDDEPAR
jgi:serine/threonine protein phosphatase PrpC